MKKPVAEVNIKIFKKGRKYCGETKIGMNSDNPELALAILKALDDTSARFKDSAKELAKDVLRNILEDEDLEELFKEDETL
jgi:hypothetical protein|nr:MAG TPA: hypothetical protein [Bacteriophage sp.]